MKTEGMLGFVSLSSWPSFLVVEAVEMKNVLHKSDYIRNSCTDNFVFILLKKMIIEYVATVYYEIYELGVHPK